MHKDPATTDPRNAGAKPPFAGQQQDFPGQESKMDPAPDYGLHSYRGLGRLTGRAAIVTGADSGIGRAVALAFAREGADVVLSYLNEHNDANQTAAAVREAGRRAVLVPGDLADEAVCAKVVEACVQAFGKVDVLVNNAAQQLRAVASIADLDRERVRRTFAVNIEAMFALSRLSLPHLSPGSSIINVASIQAYKPNPAILDYAASKGAIVAFTKGLAQELGPKGIRVNAVAPGPVWTPLIPQSFPEQKVANFGKGNPLGRAAQPAELAPAFVFLACDEARFVNAEVLGVTGGGITG